MTARSFEFGADYPGDRGGKLFAFHVVKLLMVPLVARCLGSQGCNLIRVIACMEDDQWYAGAVLATDEQLRPMLAVTERTLVTARRRCIEAGWLHYEPGSKGTPSRMWVTVPQHIDLKLRSNIQAKNYTTSAITSDTTTDTRTATTSATTTAPSYIPNTIPESPPPAAIPGDDWREVEIEMLRFGIGETSEPLNRLQANAVPTELALGILRYASQFQLWTPGRVRRRLIQLLPGQTPDDRSKWMKPDRRPDPTKEELAQAEEYRKQAEEKSRLRKEEDKRVLENEEQERERQRLEAIEKQATKQLMIDWERVYGPRLDEMPDHEVIEIASRAFPHHAQSFEQFGVRNRLVRPIVLQALAGFFNELRGVR